MQCWWLIVAQWGEGVSLCTQGSPVLADGLLGPAAPFKISQSLIPLERLYAAGTHVQAEPKENGVAGLAKDKADIVEDAVTREWHRIRMQRMGVAL